MVGQFLWIIQPPSSRYNQFSLWASDTIRAKEIYKAQPNEMGIEVKKYHGDNRIYKSKLFKDDLERQHQTMTYSGVGAHGQNGVAERAIQTVVNSTRTMMSHQALIWPAHFDIHLWPFSLEHAAYLWNHLPNARG